MYLLLINSGRFQNSIAYSEFEEPFREVPTLTVRCIRAFMAFRLSIFNLLGLAIIFLLLLYVYLLDMDSRINKAKGDVTQLQ